MIPFNKPYLSGNETKYIEDAVKDIENEGLKIKLNYETSDFLSCEIVFDKEQKKAWIGQSHLLKKMEQNFSHLVKDRQSIRHQEHRIKELCDQ